MAANVGQAGDRYKRRMTCTNGRSSVVARGGVEPPTFRFSVGRSYQLSYLARYGSCYRSGGWAADRLTVQWRS
jgi:hypothetical protein